MTFRLFSSEAIKRVVFDLEDRLFDLSHGIDTRGVVGPASLQTTSKWKAHANAYHAVWTCNLRTLVRQCMALESHPKIFVDIGCGKGKACFYAAASGLFDDIYGIDFDLSLVNSAKQNRAHFSGKAIVFQHCDATAFDLPDSRCLVFMFNPFDAEVLKLFLERNMHSFRRNGHIVAYANDINHNVLEEFGFTPIFRDHSRKISLWTPPH
jgi:SAM-dependent methyltransferase